ncbi:MAG: 6-carboxyhexanoate--CoA ligase [Sarcina sp.]
MSLYSIKMRATKKNEDVDKHISGAENIVKEEDIERVAGLLIKRALLHSQGKAENINIKVEKIKEEEVLYLEPIKATTIVVENKNQGLKAMEKLLQEINISKENAKILVEILKSIRNMRGATIVDLHSLKRLEKDRSRGIRVTYMDLENKDINGLIKSEKYNSHFIEALVLATKVINSKAIRAELCYSDDPNYTAGYVATKEFGYVRFDYLKDRGVPFGGRVFLFDSKKGSLEETINYLEEQKVIVRNIVKINENISYEKFMELGGKAFE